MLAVIVHLIQNIPINTNSYYLFTTQITELTCLFQYEKISETNNTLQFSHYVSV